MMPPFASGSLGGRALSMTVTLVVAAVCSSGVGSMRVSLKDDMSSAVGNCTNRSCPLSQDLDKPSLPSLPICPPDVPDCPARVANFVDQCIGHNGGEYAGACCPAAVLNFSIGASLECQPTAAGIPAICLPGAYAGPDGTATPCPTGFWCPYGHSCIISCSNGSFCPTAEEAVLRNFSEPIEVWQATVSGMCPNMRGGMRLSACLQTGRCCPWYCTSPADMSNGSGTPDWMCPGADADYPCPLSYFCSNASVTVPKPCASGEFCRAGSQHPTGCGWYGNIKRFFNDGRDVCSRDTTNGRYNDPGSQGIRSILYWVAITVAMVVTLNVLLTCVAESVELCDHPSNPNVDAGEPADDGGHRTNVTLVEWATDARSTVADCLNLARQRHGVNFMDFCVAALAIPRLPKPYDVNVADLGHDRRRNDTDDTWVRFWLSKVCVKQAHPITKQKTRLLNVNLAFERDTLNLVLGGSGVGKSTLLKVILGELEIEPQEGHLDGGLFIQTHNDIERFDPATRHDDVGFVPQHEDLFFELTVAENLELARQVARTSQSFCTFSECALQSGEGPEPYTVDDVVTMMFGTLTQSVDGSRMTMAPKKRAEIKAKLVRSMSGGQQKRVSIAMELIKKPKLLLCDEPTSGLDPGTVDSVMTALRDLAHLKHCIVVAVVHNPSVEVCALADRVVGIRSIQGDAVPLGEENFESVGFHIPGSVALSSVTECWGQYDRTEVLRVQLRGDDLNNGGDGPMRGDIAAIQHRQHQTPPESGAFLRLTHGGLTELAESRGIKLRKTTPTKMGHMPDAMLFRWAWLVFISTRYILFRLKAPSRFSGPQKELVVKVMLLFIFAYVVGTQHVDVMFADYPGLVTMAGIVLMLESHITSVSFFADPAIVMMVTRLNRTGLTVNGYFFAALMCHALWSFVACLVFLVPLAAVTMPSISFGEYYTALIAFYWATSGIAIGLIPALSNALVGGKNKDTALMLTALILLAAIWGTFTLSIHDTLLTAVLSTISPNRYLTQWLVAAEARAIVGPDGCCNALWSTVQYSKLDFGYPMDDSRAIMFAKTYLTIIGICGRLFGWLTSHLIGRNARGLSNTLRGVQGRAWLGNRWLCVVTALFAVSMMAVFIFTLSQQFPLSSTGSEHSVQNHGGNPDNEWYPMQLWCALLAVPMLAWCIISVIGYLFVRVAWFLTIVLCGMWRIVSSDPPSVRAANVTRLITATVLSVLALVSVCMFLAKGDQWGVWLALAIGFVFALTRSIQEQWMAVHNVLSNTLPSAPTDEDKEPLIADDAPDDRYVIPLAAHAHPADDEIFGAPGEIQSPV